MARRATQDPYRTGQVRENDDGTYRRICGGDPAKNVRPSLAGTTPESDQPCADQPKLGEVRCFWHSEQAANASPAALEIAEENEKQQRWIAGVMEDFGVEDWRAENALDEADYDYEKARGILDHEYTFGS